MQRRKTPCLLLITGLATLASADLWTEIVVVSTADGSEQPAFFHAPDGPAPAPLLVALHSWSANYRQQSFRSMAQWCARNGWAFIQPDFRGPNNRPEATGSNLVVQDILDAVAHAKRVASIDPGAVYLVGSSGGGHAALLMAGRHPEVWAGVSAWVPIVDLAAWYRESLAANRRYARDLAQSCGGAPGDSPAVDAQYRRRSPLTYLERARTVPLQISAGIRDGHEGSVPVGHALRAFNAVANPSDRLSDGDIAYIVREARVPDHLQQPIEDPSYGRRPPLFRRTSGRAVLTLFDGGHQMVAPAAMRWLETVHRERAGANP